MAITKLQAEALNLADTYAFTGTVTGAGGGKVLQVVFGSTSTETRNSTNTLADTGLSASITPSATIDDPFL